MPTCRRFTPQNWLLWQRTLTKVYQIFSHKNFFIDGVNATIRVEIRAPVSNEREDIKKRKSGGLKRL